MGAIEFDGLGQLRRDQRWLHMERYWNLGSPSGFHESVPPGFRPQDEESHFALPVHDIDHAHSIGLGRRPSFIPQEEPTEGRRSFAVISHPAVVPSLPAEHGGFKARGDIRGVPTASQRTYAVVDEQEGSVRGFAKLSYPGRIGRFDRTLTLYQLIHSLQVSDDLVRVSQTWPDPLMVMREYGGTYVLRPADSPGYGVIYRGLLEDSETNGPSDSDWIVPAFALMDVSQEGFESLKLMEFILGGASGSRARFLDLVARLIEVYVWFATTAGLIPEFNAQNVLLVFDPESGSVRIGIRDMADFFRDLGIRSNDNRTAYSNYKVIEDSPTSDLYERRSFAYDFKFGTYLLEPLCRSAAAVSSSNLDSLVVSCADLARDAWSNHAAYFASPSEWWSYPRSASVGRTQYVRREAPTWR